MSDTNPLQDEDSASDVLVTVLKDTETGKFHVGMLFPDMDTELVLESDQARQGAIELIRSAAIADRMNQLRDECTAEDFAVVERVFLGQALEHD